MNYFCTLFDSNYLTRGLAMYESLKKHCDDFHLFIFAFDSKTFEVFRKLDLHDMTIIALNEFEDEELLKVKPTRSKGEYCWTCTSSAILYVLENYKAESCTYLDADIYFFSSPKVLLDELHDDSVLITEHRYSPKYDQTKTSGKYCVQLITFKNDERGLKVLRWWRKSCINWCYAKCEDGKFGDQKYLDDWPTRFEGIHVLEHLGGGVAPWNMQQYSFTQQGNWLKVNGDDLIFYHYHSFKCYTNGEYDLGMYDIPEQVITLIYRPYIKALADAKRQVREVDKDFDYGEIKKYKDWTYPLRFINRRLRGYYHVIR